MSANDPSQRNGLIWGKVLVGIGAVLFVVGFAFWLFIMVVSIPGSDNSIEDIGMGGMCCFGPFGFAGLMALVVGAILWKTHSIPPSTGE
jgi:ABC-type transport system involved in multi-copper enzyme maturation permease subunit